MSARDDAELLTRGLLRNDRELFRLYRESATFKHGVDAIVSAAPHLVDALAKAAAETDALIERMSDERLMRSPIVRVDRYTISVDGQHVRATEDQERRLREMDADGRARFLRVMGKQ